jgi:phage portal protein BeeE
MWGSGVEQIILGWLKLGLGPVLTTIEREVLRQLVTVDDQSLGYYASYDLTELLRGDSAARSSFLSQMTQNGVYTRNEARHMEKLPRSSDPNADKLTVQSNMSPLDKLGTMPGNAVQVREAMRSWLGINDGSDKDEAQGS